MHRHTTREQGIDAVNMAGICPVFTEGEYDVRISCQGKCGASRAVLIRKIATWI
jgi:hypothetical protein